MASGKSFCEENYTTTAKILFQGQSPEPGCVSMKNDQSMPHPPDFSERVSSANMSLFQGQSPEPSCVSMKSDWSMPHPPDLSERVSSGSTSLFQGQSPEPSCMSMKSDWSMPHPPDLSERVSSAYTSNKQDESKSESESTEQKHLDSIFQEVKHIIIPLIEKELKMFKRFLSPDYPACFEREEEEEEDKSQCRISQWILRITLNILKKMNQADIASTLQTRLAHLCLKQHKSRLKENFQVINEGISNHRCSAALHEIYTELYITEGGSGEVNNEHEVRQIEITSWTPKTEETPVKCNDIFKPLPGKYKPIRTVLTKGVAGIGKTVSVQKFILDWAEGKANHDLHFIFPLPFRELNLIKKSNLSLIALLQKFFTHTNDMISTDLDDFKVLFIFDGLDECRLGLDFLNNPRLSEITESASVDVLLTNLIRGNLLPSSLIWITSRPAAANQIPAEYLDLVTDVLGFNDPQKDEYFRKKINDQGLASKIITHIKSSRSLYIMCHIPVFCWISATVLQRMLSETESAEIPKTLTQMFIHFLIFQTKLKSLKYDRKCDLDLQQAKKSIISLGKLAFQQLEKGNLIFYEEDLSECGIDVKDASVYSGVCTQIFREEFGLYLGKVYSFVHLTIQEFLAALYKFICTLEQATQLSSISTNTLTDFLKSEVDKALQSKNGHLDLFLRFLLGLSRKSNQTVLKGLLINIESICNSEWEIVEYIKMKVRMNPSPEKSINLFHCLNELNDRSLVQEVQTYLSKSHANQLFGVKLHHSQWSALVFVLLNSEEKLNEFQLSKYHKSEECLLSLLPVIKASSKADLSGCNLTEKSCSALAIVLSLNASGLRDLNLSDNSLQDSGVKLLYAGLTSDHCKLRTLRLSNCSFGEEGCSALVSALKLNPSHLRELDLNYNKLGDSGMKLLSGLLQDPQCKLEKVLLYNCSIGAKGFSALALALRSNPSHLRELDLSYNKLGDSGLKFLLQDWLQNPHCKLKKLMLTGCNITDESCLTLQSFLRSKYSSLRELNLSYNNLKGSGAGLMDPQCQLKTLELCDCGIKNESIAVVASTLRSKPSHLRELNFNYNGLGDNGVKLLTDLLQDSNCKLEKLLLRNCCIREKGCAALVSALKSNPSHLRELNLSYNKLGDSVILLSDLLRDSHCKLEKLLLNYCSITSEGCSALASALRSNPSHLKELDMGCNNLGDSEVQLLSDLLQVPLCKIEILHTQ